MVTLLVMTCINVNSMLFCTQSGERKEVSFYKREVESIESLDFYFLPKADMYSAAEAIYGSSDRAPRMPELQEGCQINLDNKTYYYEFECKKLRRKL